MSKIKEKKRVVYTILMVMFLTTTLLPFPAFAYDENEPDIIAKTAVLYDVGSGKVLYGKDEHNRMYPGSMTKLLTAIVFLDNFTMDEYIICGDEVGATPPGSSLAGNKIGEVLSVENALRALIIPSGNETSCVVARAVAKKVLKDENISYANAEHWFAEQMNKKAVEIGCLDTNFVNPHGFHDARHYTTAYDMALIAAEAMKNPYIERIASEVEFSGNGAGNNPDPDWKTNTYNWVTHNEIVNPMSPYYYPYATGIKTGFHNEAGDCLAASATKDGRDLIAVIMYSMMPGRWLDSTALFEYGFNNFAHEIIQEGDTILGEAALSNVRLGEPEAIEYMALGSKTDLLTKGQLSRIVKEVSFTPELIAEPSIDEETGAADKVMRLKTPIAEGQVIGTVSYLLDGDLIFLSDIVSTSTALERTWNSDVDYYIGILKQKAFSPFAVPVYTVIALLLIVIIKVSLSSKKRRQKGMYTLKRRY